MNDDLDIISNRINLLFKRASRTRYWIVITNDHFDNQYNFFFNSQRKGLRERSVPLHSVTNYKLEYLEALIKLLQQDTKLTMYFSGFENLRWPISQLLIQRK